MSSTAPLPANENDDSDVVPVITSISLQERRLRTLKQGDTFGVFDHNGDANGNDESPEGIFHNDTRHLSRLTLTVGGLRPLLLGSTLRDDNAVLTCDLTNPDLADANGNRSAEHNLIHIRRSRFLWNGACFERILVRNFGDRPHRIRIAIHFEADFADVFEVRGSKRPARGRLHDPLVERDRVMLAYTGRDGVRRETNLRFHPAPARLTARVARFDLDIGSHQSKSVLLEIDCGPVGSGHTSPVRFFTSMRDARRALRRLSARATAIETSNDLFNESVRRAVADLYMLVTEQPEGLYPYAGVPWFSTVFGRDAIITGFETLWMDPGITRGVLAYLARNQAQDVIPEADAEPGKILHEVRHGEMAELGEVPFRRYYGSVDSTPLFVMLAGAYYERTTDIDTIRNLWPNIEAALGWIDTYGDRDSDGFVEYGRATGEGLVNQGWKDSHDSVFHEDGSIASGPIALAEVQAYVYGAWNAAATLAHALGQEVRAAGLRRRADELQRRFDRMFFDEELGTYVLALDGSKRPCRVRSSNAGHALFTGLAYKERADAVVAQLMGPSFFSGWGVRTIPSTEARFNPMSYHNGSVWPHDNALLAAGFARYGYRTEVLQILDGLFAASSYLDLRRLPELFCGFPRKRGQGPTAYPVACSPQAWAAVAPLSLLQSCLGISFDPARGIITLDRPVLPEVLSEVRLSRLAIGERYVNLELRRAAGEVTVNVVHRQGNVRVLTIS
jgi:glycogen debranching enzyme